MCSPTVENKSALQNNTVDNINHTSQDNSVQSPEENENITEGANTEETNREVIKEHIDMEGENIGTS